MTFDNTSQNFKKLMKNSKHWFFFSSEMVVKIVKCSQRHQSEHSVTQQVSFTRTELGQRRDHSTWFLQKPKQNNGLKKTRTKGSGLRHTCPSSKESDVETDVCPVSHRETQWYQPCMATAVSDGVHCRSPLPKLLSCRRRSVSPDFSCWGVWQGRGFKTVFRSQLCHPKLKGLYP